MDETKVQIGEEVLLDIGIHSEWYKIGRAHV